MQLQDSHLKEFEKFLQAKGMLKATTECYVRDVGAFMQWLEKSRGHHTFEGNTDIEHFLVFLAQQQKDSENSVRRKLISLKQFFRFAYNNYLKQSSPVDEIPIPSRNEALPDTLDYEQIETLIHATNETNSKFKALRDRAILCLLSFEGLKAAEIISLKWSDFIVSGKRLGSLKVVGRKPRVISLIPDTADAISSYKDHLRDAFPDIMKKNIAMFTGILGRSGLPAEKPISRHGIKFMLYDLGLATNIKKLNTELLRHYAITFHLNLGKSPDDVMNHLGLRQLGNIGKHARKISTEQS